MHYYMRLNSAYGRENPTDGINSSTSVLHDESQVTTEFVDSTHEYSITGAVQAGLCH